MQQYTTQWAKEYLRDHKNIYAMTQDKNLQVVAWHFPKFRIDYEEPQEWVKSSVFETYVGKMLEHPDGWQKSLVTREML